MNNIKEFNEMFPDDSDDEEEGKDEDKNNMDTIEDGNEEVEEEEVEMTDEELIAAEELALRMSGLQKNDTSETIPEGEASSGNVEAKEPEPVI